MRVVQFSLSAFLFLLCLPLVQWLPVMVYAQENHCDPDLDRPEDYALGYRLRVDRCEGVYIKDVGNTTLSVVSLTESFEDYDFSDKDLLIEWTAPSNGGVRIRAQGISPRLYYRMDTVRPPGNTSYTWPSNILGALILPREDIGVVGWTRYSVGESERDVYVPLRIGQQANPLETGHYQIVLLPGHELTEVYISLALVGADGRPGAFRPDEKALGYGYYPAGRGVTISIPNLEEPGIYYLEIGAVLKGGGATIAEVWVYHPGR